MRLVLLGDLHFYSLRLRPWQLLSKRVLGQTNLWLSRRHRFDLSLVDGLLDQIASTAPDRILCVGDLTTTSLRSEFELAVTALEPTLDRYGAVVVPGNHDRYTWAATRGRLFESYFERWSASAWPHTVELEPKLSLIGLDPTRPTWCTASGRLGDTQTRALASELAQRTAVDRVIVLCHYPIGTPPGHPPEAWQHRLRDASALRQVLGASSSDVLYLHGHEHAPWVWRLSEAPNVVAINAGAPLMTGPEGRWPRGQGFWQIDTGPDSVDNDGQPWRLTHHRADAAGEWVAEPIPVPVVPGQASQVC